MKQIAHRRYSYQIIYLPGATVSGIGGISVNSVTGSVMVGVVGLGLGLVLRGLSVLGTPSPSQFMRKLGGVP